MSSCSRAANAAAELLSRSLRPRVSVAQSALGPEAGLGVFASQPLAKGTVACLYPGLYWPAVPPGAYDWVIDDPAGDPAGEYTINLRTIGGGRIDGDLDCLRPPEWIGDAWENPNAVGQIVNHDDVPNLTGLSFLWHTVLRSIDVPSQRYTVPNFPTAAPDIWFHEEDGRPVLRPCAPRSEEEAVASGLAGLAFVALRAGGTSALRSPPRPNALLTRNVCRMCRAARSCT